MRTQNLKIIGLSLITLFSIVTGTFLSKDFNNPDSVLFITSAIFWIMFSGFINLICRVIPSIKIKAKTKSPIYRIEEIYYPQYRVEKHEIVCEHIDSLICLFTLPFIWLFKFPVYEKVFYEDVEENNVSSIEDLGKYVEEEIARIKELKRQIKEIEAKKQEPIDRLNQQFKENYIG